MCLLDLFIPPRLNVLSKAYPLRGRGRCNGNESLKELCGRSSEMVLAVTTRQCYNYWCQKVMAESQIESPISELRLRPPSVLTGIRGKLPQQAHMYVGTRIGVHIGCSYAEHRLRVTACNRVCYHFHKRVYTQTQNAFTLQPVCTVHMPCWLSLPL